MLCYEMADYSHISEQKANDLCFRKKETSQNNS